MKEKYEKVRMKIVMVKEEDIIITSELGLNGYDDLKTVGTPETNVGDAPWGE